jgi:hypothetical protein
LPYVYLQLLFLPPPHLPPPHSKIFTTSSLFQSYLLLIFLLIFLILTSDLLLHLRGLTGTVSSVGGPVTLLLSRLLLDFVVFGGIRGPVATTRLLLSLGGLGLGLRLLEVGFAAYYVKLKLESINFE